jgi:hypothetical protein
MVVFPSGISSEHLLVAAPFLAPNSPRIDRALPSLVLTGDQALRERLRRIAEGRGCACRAPATVAGAWQEATSGPGLVFVDVAHPLDGRRDEARLIAEVVARRPKAMLVVCGTGDAGTGDDERWARELGAFVYLPGVGTSAGVALIVDEAQRIFRGQS